MSLKKLVNEITKPLTEDIKIPVSVGDTILTGRFKNKKTKVKSIGKDDYGMPTINGRKIVNFRVAKVDEEGIVSADGTIQGGSKVSNGFGVYDEENTMLTNELGESIEIISEGTKIDAFGASEDDRFMKEKI